MPDQIHHVVDLDLRPHEASGLVTCRSAGLREALGLDPLYWTVLDDGPVEECIALVGQVAGTVEPTAGWTSHHLRATISTPVDGDTDDGEAIAEHDGWITVIGSAYGSKEGPLEPERSFVARFHVDDVTVEDGTPAVDLHVVADPFVLHRVVNDALHDAGADLLAWSPKYQRKTVGKARKKALGTPWAWRIAHDDSAINIEGAVHLPDGSLLLGLRVPVTRRGQALLVRVTHPDRLFDPAAADPVGAEVVELTGHGDRSAPVGVRDLALHDGRLHVILGDLDSDPDDSILLDQHPEGGVAESVHVVCDLPEMTAEEPVLHQVPVELIHAFDGLSRVEGLAFDDDGHALYVSDEDETVRTRFFSPDAADG